MNKLEKALESEDEVEIIIYLTEVLAKDFIKDIEGIKRNTIKKYKSDEKKKQKRIKVKN
ncbi:MAG: hypothetical protein PHF86_01490 [Candidatus Nanoarchaeia archaeon]|jgi:hypothetical protein|nr:hypothetical protein [Candidatus Nanoarchaeia archaeon]